jgi:hypothetical protein
MRQDEVGSRMIPKSEKRFSDKIMRQDKVGLRMIPKA